MLYGNDYIGGVNYINRIIRYHPRGFALGVLQKVDGWHNGLTLIRTFLSEHGESYAPLIRTHGLWVDLHRYNSSHISVVTKEAKKLAKVKERFPDANFMFSPLLENYNEALIKKCRKACRNVLPKEIKIVSSSVILKKGVNEVHHGAPVGGKYIHSFDGKDMLQIGSRISEWKRMHAAAIAFYSWIFEFNGLEDVDDNTPRPQRNNWPRKLHFKRVENLLRNG